MDTSKFDFKKHQNFSKSWKMIIRFLIYTIVISVLVWLIYSTEKPDKSVNIEDELHQINVELDEVETE